MQQASTTPFRQSFDYSSLGNITGWKTNDSATTSYSYSATGKSNPHAPTSIGGVTLTYDDNGNLTSYGSTTLIWDYRNRITELNTGNGTSTYAYDHNNQRVKKVFGGVTTYYPNMYWNIAGATTTRHIFDNEDNLIAVIEGSGTATTTYYVHTDHLGGTNVMTNTDGEIVQTLDYYPYGAERIDSGPDISQRQYIGQEFDEETDLSYLNARYYDSARGQFLSQDPVFLLIGDPERIKNTVEVTQTFVLQDPQLMNSYSYGRNNPITNKDPNGNIPIAAPLILLGIGSLVNVAMQSIEDRIAGQPAAWENYAGAAIGGLAGTASLLSGYGVPATGAVTSGVEDAATQSLNLLSGRQSSYNPTQTLGQTAGGALFGKYLNPKISGVTIGNNSFKAVQGQIVTKISNGTIQSFTPQTSSKILTNQFVSSLPQSATVGLYNNSDILRNIQLQISSIQRTINRLIESRNQRNRQ